MRTTLTALALAGLLLSPAPTFAGLAAAVQIDTSAQSRTRADLEVTFFHPQTRPATLVNALMQLTETSVYWREVNAEGEGEEGGRERFIVVGDALLIQDFPDGTREALALLKRIDGELSHSRDVDPKSGGAMLRETLRLKRLDTMSAVQLINSSHRAVQIGYSDGVPVLTLSGSAADVQAAMALIEEAERPLPQILMQWSLIEPIDPANLGDDEVASDELVAALTPLVPNKTFKSSGSFVVRGSAGGGARLEVASSISSIKGTTAKLPGDVLLHTRISGWEPETRQLNLSDCEITIQRRTSNGPAITSTTDRLSTDLSLLEGETTVIGSLGSDQVFVALTISVIE